MRLVEKAGHRHLLGEALQPVYLLDKGNLILLHFVQKKEREYPDPLCSQVPIRHNRSRCSLLFRLKLASFGNPSEKNVDGFRKKFFGKTLVKEVAGHIRLYVLVWRPNQEEHN